MAGVHPILEPRPMVTETDEEVRYSIPGYLDSLEYNWERRNPENTDFALHAKLRLARGGVIDTALPVFKGEEAYWGAPIRVEIVFGKRHPHVAKGLKEQLEKATTEDLKKVASWLKERGLA